MGAESETLGMVRSLLRDFLTQTDGEILNHAATIRNIAAGTFPGPLDPLIGDAARQYALISALSHIFHIERLQTLTLEDKAEG